MNLFKRTRQSPTILVAVIALVAALAGTALAGSGPAAQTSGAAKDAKKALKKSKKAIKIAKAADKDPGPKGDQGDPGQDGSPAASAFLARIDSVDLVSPGYGAPSGISLLSGNEANHTVGSPNVTIIARDLFVNLDNPPGSGTYTFTLRVDESGTALACTVEASDTECNSGGATVSVSSGSLLSIGVTGTGAAGAANGRIGWRATTP